MCAQEPQEIVIFTTSPDAPYESYSPDAMPHKDAKLSINFETQDIMEETLILLRFNCPDSACDYIGNGWGDLKLHVRATHGRVLWYAVLFIAIIFEAKHLLAICASGSKKFLLMSTSCILPMFCPFIYHRCTNEETRPYHRIRSMEACTRFASSAANASSAVMSCTRICGSGMKSASFANGTKSGTNSALFSFQRNRSNVFPSFQNYEYLVCIPVTMSPKV